MAFVKKFVNVLAAFLKLILNNVNQAYHPVASLADTSCLDAARPEYCVLVALSPVLEPDDVPLPEGAPTIAAVIPHTVPVNVGEAIFAFSARFDIVANNPVDQSYTAFTLGYFVLLAKSVVTLILLFATSSLSENVPDCVAREPKPKFVRAVV